MVNVLTSSYDPGLFQHTSLHAEVTGRGTPVGSQGQHGFGASGHPSGADRSILVPVAAPRAPEPGSLLGHRPADDIGSAVGRIEQGFGREVRIPLCHRRIAVTEHLLDDIETHPRLGHVTCC